MRPAVGTRGGETGRVAAPSPRDGPPSAYVGNPSAARERPDPPGATEAAPVSVAESRNLMLDAPFPMSREQARAQAARPTRH